jgi:hypothetical protein
LDRYASSISRKGGLSDTGAADRLSGSGARGGRAGRLARLEQGFCAISHRRGGCTRLSKRWQALRGCAVAVALTVVAGSGDLTRFDNPGSSPHLSG